MSFLPAVGTVSYNGYTFSAYAQTKVSLSPVPNEGMTTSKARLFTLQVTDYVQNDSGLDSSIAENIRTLLVQPHGRLEYSGRGFGNPLVIEGEGGSTSSQVDLKRGPWPKLTSWTPLGGPRAAVFTWECEAIIPPCEDGLTDTGVMAYEYTMTLTQDRQLLTTIVYEGYLEVPQPVRASNPDVLTRTADFYRHRVNIPLLHNFRRENQSYKLNQAKDRLEFTITDVQMADPIPDGMVEADVTWSVKESTLGSGKYECTLRGSYVLSPYVPRYKAMSAFILAYTGKAAHIKRYGGRIALMTNFTATEQLCGRGVEISMTLLVIGKAATDPTSTALDSPTGAGAFFWEDYDSRNDSGIGGNTKRADANYESWRKSVSQQTNPFFGTKIQHIGGREMVVSLCRSQQTSAPALQVGSGNDTLQPIQEPTPQNAEVLHAKENIVCSTNWGTTISQPAYSTTTVSSSGFDSDAYMNSKPSGNDQTQVVVAQPPMVTVSYTGTVVTSAQPYPIPEVVTIDGVQPFVLGAAKASSSVLGEIGGTVLYVTQWVQNFGLPNAPKKADTATPAVKTKDNRDVRTQSPASPKSLASGGSSNNGSAFQKASVTGLGNPGGKSPLFV